MSLIARASPVAKEDLKVIVQIAEVLSPDFRLMLNSIFRRKQHHSKNE